MDKHAELIGPGDSALVARSSGMFRLVRPTPIENNELVNKIQIHGYLLLMSIYRMVERKDPDFQTLIAREINQITREMSDDTTGEVPLDAQEPDHS